jgi:hypothetical protein
MVPSLGSRRRTEKWLRVALCLMVGFAAAWIAALIAASGKVTMDFEFYWRAAQLWLGGRDPYGMRVGSPGWPLQDVLFYPLPAVMALVPIARLPMNIAVAFFIGVPTGLLAWFLSRHAQWPLLMLASPGFLLAVLFGQWAPWLILGTLVPALGAVFLCKPSIGLACFASRPSKRAAIGCVILGVVSIALWPAWPSEWRHNLATLAAHQPPILTRWGWPLAAAALRWRERDARLVVGLACVPQVLGFMDQSPLLLIARSRREMIFLVCAAWIAALPWIKTLGDPTGPQMATAWPAVLLGAYLPALYLVLRRSLPERHVPVSTLDAG